MRTEGEILKELKELCCRPGYAYAIAVLCFRDNFVGFAGELRADDYSKLFSWSRLIRTEVSTVIGHFVKGDIDLTRPSSEELRKYVEKTDILLSELHEAMNTDFLPIFQAALRGEIDDPFANAKGMREPIFYSGESAYTFQYRDFAPIKYQKDATWLREHFGFDMRQVREIVNAIHDVCKQKANSYIRGLHENRGSEFDLLGIFTFSSQDINQRTSLDIRVVDCFLQRFSLLKGSNRDFLYLEDFNESNAFPIIVTPDSFICFQYYTLVEAIYDSPFFWMMRDADYKEQASRHRGEYLEELAETLLSKVFGTNRVFKNIKIMNGKIEICEIDNLVIYGDRAIVVQAKAKRLTIAARKGSDLQLKADFKAAIQDATNQAAACSKYIQLREYEFVGSDHSTITMPESIQEIFPLVLISDHYPALSFQCHSFLEFEPSDTVRQVFVMDVFTLDVIAEMLDSPLRFISYMQLRAKAGRRLFVTHEVTSLAFHLRNNLWLQNSDFVHLHDDISAPLDIAMAARRDGIAGQKIPDGILTKLQNSKIGALIDTIGRNAEKGIISFGLMLLRLDVNSAMQIGNLIESLAKKTELGFSRDATIWTQEDSSGLTIHCNNTPLPAAIENLEAHCTLRKYSQKARLWFGILITPLSGTIRLSLTFDYPWKQEDALDEATASMPSPSPIKSLNRQIARTRKTGRNERCPCGSGLKHKKCCGGHF